MRVYFDYNATTPLAPRPWRRWSWPLASSSVTPRACIISPAGQSGPGRVAIRGGGADQWRPSSDYLHERRHEADNFAIRGAAEALEPTGRRHLVASAIEHEAVLNTLKALGRRGWRTTLVPVDQSGIVSPDRVREAVTGETALVSVMHANNEIGTIQPIAEIAAIAHEVGAVMHTDAVQSVGEIPVDVRALGVDLLALSAHKFNGPKGAGVLWVKRGTRMQPLLTGGKHERNAGRGPRTSPRWALASPRSWPSPRWAQKARGSAAFATGSRRGSSGMCPVRRERRADRRGTEHHHISFDRVEAESLLIALDLEGVAVSTGSACSSGHWSRRTSCARWAFRPIGRRTHSGSAWGCSRPTPKSTRGAILPSIVESEGLTRRGSTR